MNVLFHLKSIPKNEIVLQLASIFVFRIMCLKVVSSQLFFHPITSILSLTCDEEVLCLLETHQL